MKKVNGAPLLIAADFGYGMTKAYNGRDYIGISSLIGEPKQIRFNTKVSEDMKGKIDLNWISAEIDGVRKFIGELAARQSSIIYKIMDKDKVSYGDTAYLMKTAIGLVTPPGSVISLITGLPLAYFDDENKQKFTDILKGKHTIKFDWNKDNSYSQQVSYEIKEIKVIPQAMGTFFDFLLTDKGRVNKETLSSPAVDNLTKGSVAVIDVGYGTTDFCVIKNLEYIERSSGSLDKAMGTVFDIIANKLVQLSGTTIPTHIITDAVIAKGSIPIQGKVYDLREITKNAIKAVSEEILVNIRAAWRTEYQIDAYIITGGGSIVMKDFFAERLGDKGFVLSSKSPVFSNVVGYWKYKLMENVKRG